MSPNYKWQLLPRQTLHVLPASLFPGILLFLNHPHFPARYRCPIYLSVCCHVHTTSAFWFLWYELSVSPILSSVFDRCYVFVACAVYDILWSITRVLFPMQMSVWMHLIHTLTLVITIVRSMCLTWWSFVAPSKMTHSVKRTLVTIPFYLLSLILCETYTSDNCILSPFSHTLWNVH